MEESAAHRLLAEGVVAVFAFQVESWKLEVLSLAGLRPRGEKLDIIE